MRWIVGDVHGMLKPLVTLLDEVSRLDRDPIFYFAGDYVNRGRESRGVIELLLTMKNAKFVRGNHDDVFDQIINGVSYADNASQNDRFVAFQWFLEHGLADTMTSYGATPKQIGRVIRNRTPEDLQQIIELIPKSHRNFIRQLPAFIEDDDLFVVHGKWPPRQTLSPQQMMTREAPPTEVRQEMLWGRYTEAELRRPKGWPKTGFFGHTPVPTYKGHEDDFNPLVGPHMILLDTAAALSPNGRLTAMCAESSAIVQADPLGRLVSPAGELKTA